VAPQFLPELVRARYRDISAKECSRGGGAMRTVLGGAILAVGLSAVGPFGAEAAEFWIGEQSSTPMVPGQFYLGVGGIGGWYQRPDFANPTAIGAATATSRITTSFDARSHFVGPGGTVGYVFGDGVLPAWLGQRVRVAFSGAFVKGDDTRTSLRTFPGASDAFLSTVDGRFASNTICLGCSAFQEQFRVTFHAYELNLRIHADHALARGWTLTPSLGVFGGHSLERYAIHDVQLTGAISSLPHDLDARTSSRRIGFDGGATLTWQPLHYLALFVGGRVGL